MKYNLNEIQKENAGKVFEGIFKGDFFQKVPLKAGLGGSPII